MSRTFEVNFEVDNAAFGDGNLEHEIARILNKIASRVVTHGCSGFSETIMDANGNDIGFFKTGRRK
jgi:hypothetical protein